MRIPTLREVESYGFDSGRVRDIIVTILTNTGEGQILINRQGGYTLKVATRVVETACCAGTPPPPPLIQEA